MACWFTISRAIVPLPFSVLTALKLTSSERLRRMVISATENSSASCETDGRNSPGGY